MAFPFKVSKKAKLIDLKDKKVKLKPKKKLDPVLADAQDMGNRFKTSITKVKKSHYAKA